MSSILLKNSQIDHLIKKMRYAKENINKINFKYVTSDDIERHNDTLFSFLIPVPYLK